MATPLSIIAVPASYGPVGFWHVGIFDVDGQHVVSKRPFRGVVCESHEDFVAGTVDYENFVLAPAVAWQQVIANLAHAMQDTNYASMADNCEHLITGILGWERISPQVRSGMSWGAAGALGGLAAASAAKVKNPWVKLAMILGGAVLSGGSRANSLSELYMSYGLPIAALV